MKQKNIFVLRNNDLGDVLVATPLVEALKSTHPESKISIGVGDWAKPLLGNNPNLDEIISCNAPWHNKQNCRFPANSPKTFFEGLLYVLISKESRKITKKKFTHGIDVLGSRQGSWLLRRARIANRFGVRGYAGGDNWCLNCIQFREDSKVAEAALSFLAFFGVNKKVEPRPKIYLTKEETNQADLTWGEKNVYNHRIVIAAGGGFDQKCWGDDNFSALTKLLLRDLKFKIYIIGSKEDKKRIRLRQNERVKNLCGELTLRQSAALVSSSDFVFTNSSLCMHLAGAFKIPSLTLLGDWYDSADLHHKQWGYPEGIVLGREKTKSRMNLATVEEAYELFSNLIQLKAT